VRAVATPGHTSGHQSLLVRTDGEEVLIGDAAYTRGLYLHPDRDQLPDGQAADRTAWKDSVQRLHAMNPRRVHFCHDARVVEQHV